MGAILPIMLALLMQISLNEINHYRASAVARLLHNASIRTKLAGEPSVAEMDSLRTEIANIYRIDMSRVSLSLDRSVIQPGGHPAIEQDTDLVSPPLYTYEFELDVPIDKVVVAPRLFRLNGDESRSQLRLNFEAVSSY
jgi:hypothetical protein